VSGRWSGTLTLRSSSGRVQTQPLYLILSQQGSALTGSAGADERSQSAIRNGRVIADEFVFQVGAVSVRLHFNGALLEGVGSRADDARVTATITVTRVSDNTLEDRLPPLLYEGSDRSPRMLALREAVQTRGSAVVEDFWKSVTASGAPLVEPISGNDLSYLVTFLWRGRDTTTNVLLVRGRFSQFQPANNLLSHLDGTDVWFKTLKLRHGSRFQYTFSENDPQGTLPPGKGERSAVHDFLNPRHLPEDTTTPRDRWVSILELPGAAPQPWYATRTDVPALLETRHQLKSTVLNSDREVVVYTPPGYRPTGPGYPSVYLFDGEDPDGLVFAASTVANLIHDGKIPPLVIVRIINPSETVRQLELSCLPAFANFLASDLISFVRHTYNVSTDPAKTGIGGYSLGGLAAAYAGFTHPETFGLVLAQSGSFWFEPTGTDEGEPNWLARQFVEAPKRPLRFYLEAGLYEVDLQGRGRGILETSRDLRNVLRAKGYDVDYHEFPGDHDYLSWRGTFADALIDLFGADAR
jgi:enterochelin esterase-like enzyme